eukprot:GHVS01067195.1.p1 GENE.GHVS01067195.1~~GHVS01067195.1.p1  ORF type:complete len:115 (+),score=2.59 GHVS01067195.1:246-590(+)
MTQFPLVSAIAVTFHKLQGCTLTSPLVIPTLASTTAAAAYTILTRIKDLNQLYILNRVPEETIRKWKISPSLSAEYDRLQKISTCLMLSFFSLPESPRLPQTRRRYAAARVVRL